MVNFNGNRLKQLRKEKGLTLQQVADSLTKQSGKVICKSTISRWEKEKQGAPFKRVQLVADYFDVSVDYLMGACPVSAVNVKMTWKIKGKRNKPIVTWKGK